MNDSAARAEWGWHAEYDLSAMVEDMLEKIAAKCGYN
jgi:nucleoside-diphosphate-sugar epimerase